MWNKTQQSYEFGDFRLNAGERQLLRRGKPVPLNAKTFEMLLALVENHGRLLTKEDLFSLVWSDQFVEESNLTVNMSAIRKALGERAKNPHYIQTVSGKGYRFVADVRELGWSDEEIVIESETLSRLTVEHEEIENENDTAFLSGIRGNKRTPLYIGSLLALAAMFVIGGYFWLPEFRQKQFATTTSTFQAGSIKRLTTKGNVQLADLSPDGKLFVYTTSDFENQSLWVGYSEGGEHIQLRPNEEVSYHWLAFAPDGGSLFYTMSEAAKPTPTLYKSPVLGGVPEKIREGVASSISISPDGRQIAFVQSKPGEKRSQAIMVSNIDESETRELSSLSGIHRFIFGSLSWSPDGNKIAYSAIADETAMKQNLYAIRVSDGSVEQITKDGWSEITKTAWLKDGSGLMMLAESFGYWDSIFHEQIWHVSYPGGETSKITSDLSNYNAALGLSNDSSALLTTDYRQMMNIWVAPADDLTNAKQVTFGSFGRNDGFTGLAWTPDEKIVYTSTLSNSQVVSEMNADGGEVKQLTSPGYVDSQLSVSDDGSYIFFHSTRSGLFEIWRMDADGKNAVQLTKSGHNYQSYASPDGKWVYYKAWHDNIGTLWRIPTDGGEPQQMTDKECSWACVSPDGKYFACDYRTDKRRLAIFPIDGGQPISQFEFPASALRWFGMHWTPDSKAIAYRDKHYGVWKQPIEGGEPPQRIKDLPKDKIYRFAWSRDGDQLAFVRGSEVRDVVLISNIR